MSKIQIGIVGSGWRAEFFLRIAGACPDQFEIVGITSRNPEKRASLNKTWGVDTFANAAELVENKNPKFVITSVPWDANVGVIKELVNLGVPVLSETPPAPTVEGLIELNELVASGAKIQVAEQFHLQPFNAARLKVANDGLLGPVSQAQVSIGHGYHGISLLRKFLGITYETCTISGKKFTSPIMDGPTRLGPPIEEKMLDSDQQLFTMDFGDKLGVLDFTSDQYFSWFRSHRLLVRGERGEINNDNLIYMQDYQTPIKLDFVRHATGSNGNIEGNHLQGIQIGAQWVYKNPFIPAQMTDEEIAIATCMVKMAEFIDTGKEFYPLAEASQDHYLSLMSAKSIEENTTIQTARMPWAKT